MGTYDHQKILTDWSNGTHNGRHGDRSQFTAYRPIVRITDATA